MVAPDGYRCEFIDPVPEDFYCKICTLVARRLTITDCCGESFCQTCIASSIVCPACKEEEYSTLKHVKNQREINGLQVYCSMKERGCVWSGTLDQLDTHLDPHLDNCQYVDTKCPLNCLQTIPKNKVDQHVAQECTKRSHVCQHCGFKATYEEVVDTHLPECKYVPLQCPNMCGVSCEREVMEDHIKICRLEEVECEFSSVGCDGRFIREDEDEHARQNSQKHLTLTASLAVETKEQLQQKFVEQIKENEELKNELMVYKLGMEAQDAQIQHHQQKLQQLEQELQQYKEKMTELQDTVKRHEDEVSSNQLSLEQMYTFIGLKRKFEMKNFRKEMTKDMALDWRSPATYTHVGGYKVCLGVDANGCGKGRGRAIRVYMWSMSGEFDDQLDWVVKVKFTLELVHQKGGENVACSMTVSWPKPLHSLQWLLNFSRIGCNVPCHFLEHYKLRDFLVNDSLHFHITCLEVL